MKIIIWVTFLLFKGDYRNSHNNKNITEGDNYVY